MITFLSVRPQDLNKDSKTESYNFVSKLRSVLLPVYMPWLLLKAYLMVYVTVLVNVRKSNIFKAWDRVKCKVAQLCN